MLFILIIVFLHILCFFTSFTFSVQIGSISSNTDAKKQQGNKNTDKIVDESVNESAIHTESLFLVIDGKNILKIKIQRLTLLLIKKQA